jgi:hypothetical protein
MKKTTLTKTTEAAETLAASVILAHLLKDADVVGNLEEHREKLEMIATLVMASFTPAEA